MRNHNEQSQFKSQATKEREREGAASGEGKSKKWGESKGGDARRLLVRNGARKEEGGVNLGEERRPTTREAEDNGGDNRS